MQDIGYQNRNAIYGLGTFYFLIISYFIRCGLVLLLNIYIIICKKKLRNVNNLLKKGLFYNNLFEMAIEGLIELLINSYLNLKTIQISSNGEIMGA